MKSEALLVQVTWTESADRLLQQRDRFTQRAIRQEFEAVAASESSVRPRSIEFDAARQGYLTAVADERYSVVWYLENDAAVVRAVVPTTRFPAETPNLKARVQNIVQLESNGAVNVE
jgi:hypothetical protein